MPCSDSSSGLNLFLTADEVFERFEFAKITCSSAISADTGLSKLCRGKTLESILDLDFYMLRSVLDLNADEERQFIMYLELDALKSAVAEYMGVDYPGVDRERCRISSIEHDDQGISIALVVLPPQELPKIMPCSMKDS